MRNRGSPNSFPIRGTNSTKRVLNEMMNHMNTRPRTRTDSGPSTALLRREIGDVLRGLRQTQRRTLREVSSAAQVSLGYLSEVERGQKEASSELLSSICSALSVPLSVVLREVADRIALIESVNVPDTIPPDFEFAGAR